MVEFVAGVLAAPAILLAASTLADALIRWRRTEPCAQGIAGVGLEPEVDWADWQPESHGDYLSRFSPEQLSKWECN